MSKKKKVNTKHLFHAVCHLNVIPVRVKPTIDESILSQMLFGETCIILEKKNKHWFKVKTSVCGTIGWINPMQVLMLDEKQFEKCKENVSIALDICHPIFNDEISKSIVIGSALPHYDGISCIMPDNKYVYNGQATSYGGLEVSGELLVKFARRYLFSPELKGGRSPFGIDAGALIQNIFNFFNIRLPRIPHEQSLEGEIIDFVEQSVEGDVAYCMDDEGQIHHAGLVIGEKKVLHVHGCVRIDKLDHLGFYNQDLQKYTHKLRFIKRIV